MADYSRNRENTAPERRSGRALARLFYFVAILAGIAFTVMFGLMSYHDQPEPDDIPPSDYNATRQCVFVQSSNDWKCTSNPYNGDGGPFGYGFLAFVFGVGTLVLGGMAAHNEHYYARYGY